MLGISLSEIFIVLIIASLVMEPKDVVDLIKISRKFFSDLIDLKNTVTTSVNDIYLSSQEQIDKKTQILGDDGNYYDAFDLSALEEINNNRPLLLSDEQSDSKKLYFIENKNNDDNYTLH